LKVAYLLENAGLCGGVKVVLRQAEALLKRGHDTSVFCPGPYPDWFEGNVIYEKTALGDFDLLKTFDRIIATTPRLVLMIYHFPDLRAKLYHLAQGYEGDYEEVKDLLPVIEEAYGLPLPKITLTRHLTERLSARFGAGPYFMVGQGFETQYFFHQRHKDPVESPIRVEKLFLVGLFDLSIKRIPFGLKAFDKARQAFPELSLIRISARDTRAEEERLVGPIAEYHLSPTSREVGDILRERSGVFLSPSDPGEGFGLPAIEAMACGVPTILTDIPSYTSFATPRDYAKFVSYQDLESMAEAILQVASNKGERERLIKRGIEVASQYSFDKVAEALEKALTA
jgi:glycosyltransferase involved in cell wall biosynthesis